MRIFLAIFIVVSILSTSCSTVSVLSAVPDTNLSELTENDFRVNPMIIPVPSEIIKEYKLINSTLILLNNWDDIKGAKKLLKNYPKKDDAYYFASALINFTSSNFAKAGQDIQKVNSNLFELAKEIILADIYVFQNVLQREQAEIIANYESLKLKSAQKPYLIKYADCRINSINSALEKQPPVTFIMSPWNF